MAINPTNCSVDSSLFTYMSSPLSCVIMRLIFFVPTTINYHTKYEDNGTFVCKVTDAFRMSCYATYIYTLIWYHNPICVLIDK